MSGPRKLGKERGSLSAEESKLAKLASLQAHDIFAATQHALAEAPQCTCVRITVIGSGFEFETEIAKVIA